jgi:hypothetical protein
MPDISFDVGFGRTQPPSLELSAISFDVGFSRAHPQPIELTVISFEFGFVSQPFGSARFVSCGCSGGLRLSCTSFPRSSVPRGKSLRNSGLTVTQRVAA